MTAYDVVIVGAGSAGCVLANRLSADPACRVLLLEAGPRDGHVFLRMPAGVAKAIGSKRFNWHYWTTPQTHLDGRRLTTPRGRTLGGSSAINALVYIRGHRADYDTWAEMGCPGWSHDDVLPYFRRIESHPLGAGTYHGASGPLAVSNPESENPAFAAFIAAGHQMGLPVNHDFNGAAQDGVGPFQLNIRDGKRCSAADAFLHPVAARPNLTVRTDARATGLVRDGVRVTGVRVATAQGPDRIAAGAVVLSAGSIGTPQLLMLSGFGPADHLRAQGIDVALDLPGVGSNLHDHLEVKVKFRMTQPWSMWSHAKFPNYLWTGLQYLTTGKGAGRQQGLEAGGFVRVDPGSTQPDTQLHFVNALAFDGATAADRGHGFAIDATQLRPESRGTLRLASDDPAAPPLIDPNYLAEPEDRRMLREGLKFLREICRQPALAALCGAELRPGPHVTSDADLDALVRATAESIYHPVGTAQMGQGAHAVVDPVSMAVYGTDGLFVADASVMPRIVSGNTNAPSIMIGAKGADLIAAKLG